MKVAAVADTTGSGWYRVRQIARELNQGDQVRVHVLDDGFPMALERDAFRGALIPDVDVVLLERPMGWMMPGFIQSCQQRGIAVVVEVDDDFHSLHPLQTGFGETSPTRSPGWHRGVLRECCKLADLVTVSTPALARRYGAHGRAAVLRNCVDDAWLEIPHKPFDLVVGWSGTVRNHPTDLDATRGGVAAALEDVPGSRFLCIGGADSRQSEVQRRLRLTKEPECTPWMPLDGIYPQLMTRLMVGIAPLADTRFNAAKSWLKGVEYAALGVPFVASALPEYAHLAALGAGEIMPPRRRYWRRAVRQLLVDHRRCEEASGRGRSVARELAISRNAWRWAEAWQSAIYNRRRRGRRETRR